MSPIFATFLVHARSGFRASDAVEASGVTWTGRSALSAVTETSLSRFVTSGSRCTRLSAMRVSAARAGDSSPSGAVAGTGASAQRCGAWRASFM